MRGGKGFCHKKTVLCRAAGATHTHTHVHSTMSLYHNHHRSIYRLRPRPPSTPPPSLAHMEIHFHQSITSTISLSYILILLNVPFLFPCAYHSVVVSFSSFYFVGRLRGGGEDQVMAGGDGKRAGDGGRRATFGSVHFHVHSFSSLFSVPSTTLCAAFSVSALARLHDIQTNKYPSRIDCHCNVTFQHGIQNIYICEYMAASGCHAMYHKTSSILISSEKRKETKKKRMKRVQKRGEPYYTSKETHKHTHTNRNKSKALFLHHTQSNVYCIPLEHIHSVPDYRNGLARKCHIFYGRFQSVEQCAMDNAPPLLH